MQPGFTLLCLSLAYFLTSCGQTIPASKDSASLIQGNDLKFSVNDIPNGQKVGFALKLKNGDLTKSIVIAEIDKNCSCTSTELSQKEIKPGAIAELRFLINTYGSRSYIDAVATLLWRYKDETILRPLKVELDIDVVDFLVIDHPSIDFGELKENDPPQIASIIVKRGMLNRPWDSLSLEYEGADLQTALLRRDSNTYELKVTADPTRIPIGSFGGDVRLTCKLGAAPVSSVFTIPVSGNLISDLKSSPGTVYFGITPSGLILKKAFVISSSGELSVVSVKSTNSACIATPLADKGNSLIFNCLFNSTGLHENQGGKVLVTVSDRGKRKSIAIPFIVYVE